MALRVTGGAEFNYVVDNNNIQPKSGVSVSWEPETYGYQGNLVCTGATGTINGTFDNPYSFDGGGTVTIGTIENLVVPEGKQFMFFGLEAFSTDAVGDVVNSSLPYALPPDDSTNDIMWTSNPSTGDWANHSKRLYPGDTFTLTHNMATGGYIHQSLDPAVVRLYLVAWYGSTSPKDIANEILSTIGDTYIPYSSMYDVCLNVYTNLGYTDMVDFEAVYEIINQTYPDLTASQNTGKVYGLNVNKIWVGSSEEYGSLQNHDKNVLYLIPD